MAEANPSLSQRVESLERAAQERAYEQIRHLSKRVASLEGARAAELPHLATKADVARLETQIAQVTALYVQLNAKMDAQSEKFNHSRPAAAKSSAALTENNKPSRRMSDPVYKKADSEK